MIRRLTLLCLTLAATTFSVGMAHAGPPFRTDDPEPVPYQHWEIYGFSAGTSVRGDTNATLPGLEVNYGAAPNLQLHVIVPMAYDRPRGGHAQYGLGDIELGAKYRFLREDENGWRPQIGMFPLVELPSGSATHGLGSGHTRAFFPIWIQKSFGDWTTYGGGGYGINPGSGNKNNWFAGWLLQRKITEQLTLGGEIFYQTADAVGGRNGAGFNLGGVYDVTDNHHILFSAGRAIQHAADTNLFSFYLGYQYTF